MESLPSGLSHRCYKERSGVSSGWEQDGPEPQTCQTRSWSHDESCIRSVVMSLIKSPPTGEPRLTGQAVRRGDCSGALCILQKAVALVVVELLGEWASNVRSFT